jgi:hypothetical protein
LYDGRYGEVLSATIVGVGWPDAFKIAVLRKKFVRLLTIHVYDDALFELKAGIMAKWMWDDEDVLTFRLAAVEPDWNSH